MTQAAFKLGDLVEHEAIFEAGVGLIISLHVLDVGPLPQVARVFWLQQNHSGNITEQYSWTLKNYTACS